MPSQRSITYITAGAAGMYCGSCMHDNTLARALNQLGWDTLLVPTYTPIRTDETDTTIDHVFFGGINVFLQQKIPMFRVIPRLLDRFLDQPWLIRKVTERAIETDPKMLGALTVSMLKGSQGHQKKEVRRLVSWIRNTAHPGALILSNILIAGFVQTLKESLQVPVAVTLQGDDIFLESLQEPHKSQAFELIKKLDANIDAYLVHSRYYADFMADYLGLDATKMHITPLGIDTAEFADIKTRSIEEPNRNLGYLARLTADKGLHHLVDAFIELKKDPQMAHVQLTIAGWLGEDHRRFAEEQLSKLRQANLDQHLRYLGTVDRQQKIEMLSSIDLLSVPTTYHEPKGLYILEALASGVPVVQPSHGVFPELVEQTGGGTLVPPENPNALAAEWKRLLLDDELRRKLGSNGRQNVLERRNAQAMAQSTADVISQL